MHIGSSVDVEDKVSKALRRTKWVKETFEQTRKSISETFKSESGEKRELIAANLETYLQKKKHARICFKHAKSKFKMKNHLKNVLDVD